MTGDLAPTDSRGNDATPASVDVAFPAVYEELKRIAHRALVRQQGGSTLCTTALVHEAFLKLVPRSDVDTRDRARLFGLCACAMRHIVVDHARRRMIAQRNGIAPVFDFDVADAPAGDDPESLLAIDVALRHLHDVDPRLVRLVELHAFGGLDLAEIAALLDLSLRSVQREWKRARAWLGDSLQDVDHAAG
jgi:RNA polymerase sigma factor (TIGR02999 family)